MDTLSNRGCDSKSFSTTNSNQQPWLRRLLSLRSSGVGPDKLLACPPARSHSFNEIKTIDNKGSDLLEDFPTKPKIPSGYHGLELLQDFPALPRRRSNWEGVAEMTSSSNDEADDDYVPANVDPPVLKSAILQRQSRGQKIKKTVRIMVENSTVHFYYKPNSDRHRKLLYITKTERDDFTQAAFEAAHYVRKFLHEYELERKKRGEEKEEPRETADDAKPNAKLSSDDKIDKLISSMLPCPSKFPPTCLPEEIIGIDFLIAKRNVVSTLNKVKSQQVRTVLKHFHCHGKEGEDLARVSEQLSRVSVRIALGRAAYVANLE